MSSRQKIGPCFKQTVTATLITADGERFSSTNYCEAPQKYCPRVEIGYPKGYGYHLCQLVCKQPAHAEVNVIRLAAGRTQASVIFVEGIDWICDDCKAEAANAGVLDIVLGAPPHE